MADPPATPRSARLHDLVIQSEPRAGDVLLTGCVGYVSQKIAEITGTGLSHAVLMLGDDHGIEGHDQVFTFRHHAASLADDLPGVHPFQLKDLTANGELDRLVIRRPAGPLDVERLVAVAGEYLERKTPFGGLALALCGLISEASEHLRTDSANRFRRWLGPRILEQLVPLLQDGNETVICSELVYRCLHEAGIAIELVDAHFEEVIETYDVDHADYDNDEPVLTSDPVGLRIDPDPEHLTSAVVMAILNLGQGLRRRALNESHGDIADFVVPADFLTAEPFTTILDVTRAEDLTWQATPGTARELP